MEKYILSAILSTCVLIILTIIYALIIKKIVRLKYEKQKKNNLTINFPHHLNYRWLFLLISYCLFFIIFICVFILPILKYYSSFSTQNHNFLILFVITISIVFVLILIRIFKIVKSVEIFENKIIIKKIFSKTIIEKTDLKRIFLQKTLNNFILILEVKNKKFHLSSGLNKLYEFELIKDFLDKTFLNATNSR